MTRASFFLQTGEVDACIGASLEGLQKATFQVPELLLTLGHALNHRRFYPMADVCYDAFLKADDDDQAAAEIAQARRARR